MIKLFRIVLWTLILLFCRFAISPSRATVSIRLSHKHCSTQKQRRLLIDRNKVVVVSGRHPRAYIIMFLGAGEESHNENGMFRGHSAKGSIEVQWQMRQEDTKTQIESSIYPVYHLQIKAPSNMPIFLNTRQYYLKKIIVNGNEVLIKTLHLVNPNLSNPRPQQQMSVRLPSGNSQVILQVGVFRID